MKIELVQAAKRYRNEWIFRKLDLTFLSGQTYAVSGPNGSGKSTFLKMLSGYLTPSRGKIRFSHQDQPVSVTDIHQYLALAAPYIELIEEFSLLEALEFHQRFKSFLPGITPQQFLELVALPASAHQKMIRYYSSGMKQRLKIALALCSDVPLVLLDEPTTNLDRQGINWYRSLVQQFTANRLFIIASNVDEDFDFCSNRIDIMDYK